MSLIYKQDACAASSAFRKKCLIQCEQASGLTRRRTRNFELLQQIFKKFFPRNGRIHKESRQQLPSRKELQIEHLQGRVD